MGARRYILIVAAWAFASLLCATFTVAQVGGQTSIVATQRTAAAGAYPSDCSKGAVNPPCKDIPNCLTAVKDYFQKVADEKGPASDYYAAQAAMVESVFATNSFSDNLAAIRDEATILDKAYAMIEPKAEFPGKPLRDYINTLADLLDGKHREKGLLKIDDETTRAAFDSAERSAATFKADQSEAIRTAKERLTALATQLDKLGPRAAGVQAYAKAPRTDMQRHRERLAAAKTATSKAKQTACSFGASSSDLDNGLQPAPVSGKIIVDHAGYGNFKQILRRDQKQLLHLEEEDQVCGATQHFRRLCQYVEIKVCMNPSETSSITRMPKDKDCTSPSVEVSRDLLQFERTACAVKVTLDAMCGGRDPSPGEQRYAGVIYRCSPAWSLENEEYLVALAIDGEFAELDCSNAKTPEGKAKPQPARAKAK